MDGEAVTRRPKTPRTNFERKWFDFHTELHDDAPLGYRRQPKGRRAKSGQWWRRDLCPVPWGIDVVDAMLLVQRQERDRKRTEQHRYDYIDADGKRWTRNITVHQDARIQLSNEP